ncbi:atp4 subunit B of the stator stalk of mitochondrial F1F0 ATP synthase [Rhodotorula mucilaginosa]|uniref:ATP synthase subunit 4 n=1 Tax=Rhodotorula mucilaginosa TaxID=5537 RepID=A0A9P6W4K4_RHOMI|nr:atp4 subunit B of the stator stalk of mitochondrial F1F0 ATP synthase [Rhodotorula mucilaginosa]
MLRSAAARVSRQAIQPRALAPVRFQSTSQPAPAAKASALIDALPGNSLVSKTGIVTLTAATTAAAISNELFVLNEEVVILGSFAIFLGYVSSLVREPYREWADGQIQKVKDILNTSRAAHTSAVQERIDSVAELKDVEGLTKSLFAISKETAELEHETFRLKQQAAIAAEIKSVLDSHVRYEAQLREQEQRDLVQTVLSNVQKQLTDKKLQRDILLSSVAEVEELVKSKAI